MKMCSKCVLNKDESSFSKDRRNKDGLKSSCKDCDKKKSTDYYQKNKDEIKNQVAIYQQENSQEYKKYQQSYYKGNRNHILQQKKEYAQENKVELQVYHKEHYENNKSEILQDRQEYYKSHKDEIKQYQQENKPKIRVQQNRRLQSRRANEPAFKIRDRVSSSIRLHLKLNGSSKNGNSISEFLPYTIDELRYHLESLFESWMNWNNYGIYRLETWNDHDPSTWTWQIDHIIPHSQFNYVSMEDLAFKDCWALSNLRPYSAKQNIIDGTNRIRHKIVNSSESFKL
jgi:hypothetical protein